MKKLITTARCVHTGVLSEKQAIELLKNSGGFKEVYSAHPAYVVVDETDIDTDDADSFIALVKINHKETINELKETISKVLDSGKFAMKKVSFEIGECK